MQRFLFRAGVQRDNCIVVAVSGGMDSMTLLSLLDQWEYRVIAAHMNHGLRGSESDEDEKLVRDYAKAKKVPFFSHKLCHPERSEGPQKNQHAALREARYDFLKKVVQESQAQFLCTAHHADDFVETVLMGLLSGRHSMMQGIPMIYPTLLRPMTFCWREEIADYVQREKIPYREDSSNKNPKYFRNYARHKLLPILERHIPSLKKDLFLLGLLYQREVQMWIDQWTYATEIKRSHSISIDDLKKFPEKVWAPVLRKFLPQAHRAGVKHWESFTRLARGEIRGEISWPGDFVIMRESARIYWRKKIRLPLNNTTELSKGNLCVRIE